MIHINERSMLALYEQIVQQFKELIAKGALKEGDRIPSVRELSAQLLINHNTVAKAYQELERQGIIVSQRGKGAYVAKPADEPGMEKERIQQLRGTLRRLVVEAHHLGIKSQQLSAWLQAEIESYGREEHVSGTESTQGD